MYSADTIPWSIWKKYESGKKSPRCMKRVRKIALKKMKGVKSHLVRQGFTHKCYEHAILSGKPRFVKYFTINSRSHKVGTFLKGKLGLSGKKHFFYFPYVEKSSYGKDVKFFYFLAFYDKRLIEKCKIHTTPLGFYQLKKKNYKCFKCTVVGKYYDPCNVKK